MDDLLALMDDCPPTNNPSSPLNTDNSNGQVGTSTGTVNNQSIRKKQQQSSLSSSDPTIDPLTKIRIINRQISKLDLIDFLAPFTFYTTTILSAMSNQSLSNILTTNTSSSLNSTSNLAGKTNACTMGIVFSNSGSIRSKSNKAFTKITIGDLHTGPTLSILLFGNAYSQYTTKIKQGMVVALVNMNLLNNSDRSSSRGGETRLTFSLNEVNQLELVGKALDYGICLGHTDNQRYKKWNGNSGNDSHNHNHNNSGQKVRCKNYVDLRIAKYCQYHIRQQHQPQTKSYLVTKNYNLKNISNSSLVQQTQNTLTAITNTMKAPNSGKLSFVQSMKVQRAETQMLQQKNVMYNRCGITLSSSTTATSTSGTMNNLAMTTSSANSNQSTRLEKSIGLDRSLKNVPKHMTKGSQFASSLQQQHASSHRPTCTTQTNSKKNIIYNPYVNTGTKKQNNSSHSTTSAKNKLSKSSNNDILGQALTASMSSTDITMTQKIKSKQNRANMIKSSSISSSNISNSTSSIQKKRKYIPSNLQGFDGQVYVPKPNPLFSKMSSTASAAITTQGLESSLFGTATTTNHVDKSTNPVTPSPCQKALLIERQKQLAEQMKMNKISNSNHLHHKDTTTIQSFDDFVIPGMESEPKSVSLSMSQSQLKILQSKSKYEEEAHAELFAKNRLTLTELEKKEYTHDNKLSKQNSKGTTNQDSTNNPKIKSKWICKTCHNRQTCSRPTVCIRQGHTVKRKREIEEKVSVVDRRLNLRTKDVNDGGLILGSGLEWSNGYK